jgi:hypothetical protein
LRNDQVGEFLRGRLRCHRPRLRRVHLFRPHPSTHHPRCWWPGNRPILHSTGPAGCSPLPPLTGR